MPSHPTLRFPTLHSASFSTASNSVSANHSSNSTSSSSSTNTIANGPYAMSSRVERVVLSGKSSHPMMQMTLPVDDDEPLEPVMLSSNSSSDEDVAVPELQEANVNVPKRRVFSAPSLNRSFSRGASKSAEKIQMPSLTRSFSKGAEKPPSLNKSFVKGAEKIPSFGRSSSATASATASRIVSKMAPMLRRVVSGAPSSNDSDTSSSSSSSSSSTINNSTQDAPAKSPRLGHNFLDSDDEDRDSLLFMMQVPMVRRKSHIPLMSLSHSEE